MTIERITLTHIRVPLVEPFRISNGVVAEKDGILVTIAADGVAGIGEASPMSGSFYSADTPESTWADLADVLIPGLRAAGTEELQALVAAIDRSAANPFAKAGIETALRDLDCVRKGIDLSSALGGARKSVESGLAVGIYPTISELLKAIEEYLIEGYTRVKIKIQPGWDLEPLRAVRKRFGALPLMVDANCAYTVGDLPHLCRLDEFGMLMVEQPLPKDDLEGHARVQAAMATPICMDESASDCATVQHAIALGACRIVNIKIQRVGGLGNAVAMHDLCARAGVPVWGGTMPELGIGAAQTLHLATLPNFTFPTDVESSRRWFVDDIVDPLVEVHNGQIVLPAGAGYGYRLNEKVVGKYTVRKEVFSWR